MENDNMIPSQYLSACKEFKEIFNIPLNEYIDELGITMEIVMIDIIKFDKWLQSVHPYSEDKCSVQDIVEQYYGKRGVTLIKKLL